MAFLKKVVVGEDEDAIAHLVQAALGDAGFLVMRARDGAEALRMVQRESPDLLILDIMMPQQDGIETVRLLKADPILSGVPVLMLTALSAVEDRVKGLSSGADDYLGKPFDLRELLARVRALVRLTRRERDRSASTNLPGPGGLEEWVQQHLDGKQPFHLLALSLEGFDEATSKEGWLWGQSLLSRIGVVVGQLGKAHHAYVAHVGGDDFIFGLESSQPLSPETVASEIRLAVNQAAEGAPNGNGNGHGHGAPKGAAGAKPHPRVPAQVKAEVVAVSLRGTETIEEVSRMLARIAHGPRRAALTP